MFSRKDQTFSLSPFTVENPSPSSSFSLYTATIVGNTKKKNKNKQKRRFSDEQIKSLEHSFESESRPDSSLKHELADKLELQPRQVAIWFQNKRARLKTKQIEREFSILKREYDDLSSSFESLKRENELLLVQLQKLRSIQENPDGSRKIELQHHGNEDGRQPGRESAITAEPLDKSGSKVECLCHKDQTVPKGDSSGSVERPSEDMSTGIKEDQPADDSLASSGIRCDHFDSAKFLDESGCSSEWWELWP